MMPGPKNAKTVEIESIKLAGSEEEDSSGNMRGRLELDNEAQSPREAGRVAGFALRGNGPLLFSA